MENIYFTGVVISIIYFISKFLENRFITKQDINLKQLIINTVLVYFSVITGDFIINQFEVTSKPLTVAPVFADGPGF
tara:strand:- start:942 stop:1172 length:231 start_codon:yes stop_codon:yes gene_type:complete